MNRPLKSLLPFISLFALTACEQAAAAPPPASAESFGSGLFAIVLFLFSATLLVLLALVAFLAVTNHLELRKLTERLHTLERTASTASSPSTGSTPSTASTPITTSIPPVAVAVPPLPLDPQTLSIVITAAVAAVLHGRPFRVRKIHMADRPSLSWSLIGRENIHASHAIDVHH